jgi:transposase
MSTSILYHGFGLRDHRYLRTEYVEGTIIFHVEVAAEKRRCAQCDSRDFIKKGRKVRRIRTLPIGKRPVFVAAHLYRLRCRACHALRQEPLLWCRPKKRWTRALGRYIVDLLGTMTVEDVARYLGMSWDTVKEIHAESLGRKFRRRRVRHLRYLGVDEVAVRKGHSYLTIVVDLESGEVVWVGEGRSGEALEPFLRRLKRTGAPIRAIALDMWPAYLKAVRAHFSQDVMVFDRYHVIADYNRMLDKLRTEEAARAAEPDRAVFKGVRYLLLKGREKIRGKAGAESRLKELLALNERLSTAYVLKEELRELWMCRGVAEATAALDQWLVKARASNITALKRFANKLFSHAYGILNFFRHRVTTGPVEGINNKIKVLKRKAYGYRDIDYFKLRIYFLHESRYALLG